MCDWREMWSGTERQKDWTSPNPGFLHAGAQEAVRPRSLDPMFHGGKIDDIILPHTWKLPCVMEQPLWQCLRQEAEDFLTSSLLAQILFPQFGGWGIHSKITVTWDISNFWLWLPLGSKQDWFLRHKKAPGNFWELPRKETKMWS